MEELKKEIVKDYAQIGYSVNHKGIKELNSKEDRAEIDLFDIHVFLHNGGNFN